MENNINQQETSNENTVKNDSTKAVKNNDDQMGSQSIPYNRFSEVNGKLKESQAEIEELKATINKFASDKKAQDEANLQEKGEYKNLWEEQKKANLQLTEDYTNIKNEWTEYKEEKTANLIELIPEDKREFADGMPFKKLEKYANSFSTPNTNAQKTNTQRPGNTGGDFGGYSSYVEWAQKDPEGYKKANNSVSNGGIKLGFE